MQTARLNDRLSLSSNAMDRIYRQLALQAGMSDSVFWTLCLLRNSPVPLTSAQLVQYGGLPKQTVSSALAAMRRDGYVVQKHTRGPISLSGHGRSICCSAIFSQVQDTEYRVLEAMGAEKAESFVALFEEYAALFGQLERDSDPAQSGFRRQPRHRDAEAGKEMRV
ncbi:MarR family winged helix-turn-helix transcriptional regulator [Faecalibaculum rodentium]|uniref:MarR family winged helix-turn-helix transcriptional regulator n=1 Tax=Faecalibaculum rodentium TaxID=1702221 RepID=UPI0023F3DC46|nr:helix-turn-helix domain-containing protein [Faecalibaculum rodentium]